MAAAYASLVSLSHILRQISHPPRLNKIIIDREQIEFLASKVDFLIVFLETYCSRRGEEIQDMEARIRAAAYAAEDLIESNVVTQICRGIRPKWIKGFHFMVRKFEQIKYRLDLRRMVKELRSIEKELMKKIKSSKGMEDLQPKSSTSSRPLPGGKIVMVGFERHLIQMMEELTTPESNRKIISIVGMGGIGKTTLAIAVFDNRLIVEHFDVRAWITVSQEYTIRELLLRLLCEIKKTGPDKQESTDDELGLQLHKVLFGRKYLIVLDDMWNIESWEKLKMFLPTNENGSRILMTTRLSNLIVDSDSCTPYKMNFLDEGQSWDLLCRKIFAEEDCPSGLEEIGKDIAKRCSGLPLALVVVGGLLANSERRREHWDSIAGDVSSALSHGKDEHLMNILSLSYIHLPVYLKPCFLYLAMFPEDSIIRVSTIVRLWVAEGLIKQTRAKCLEEVAYEYLEDLISRNLILVHERGSTGKVRCCKIHDLIRDMCIIEAEKEKFLCIAKVDNPSISPNIETERRLSISLSKRAMKMVTIEALQSAKFNRSLLCYGQFLRSDTWVLHYGIVKKPSEEWELIEQVIHGFRLLKIVHVNDRKIHIDILKLCNLRYVVTRSVISISSMSLCWNLQTLVVDEEDVTLPVEIWQMPQLRHLKMARITLPDPPPNDQNVIVLENLQTLATIENFKCTKRVSKRIPNLKKLRTFYDFRSSAAHEQVGSYCLEDLASFKKLESLGICGAKESWTDVAFPISLKKLSLENCSIPWEDLSIVGLLPNLEVLKLYGRATKGEEWNPIEGEFCRLKFLLILGCELKIWGAEDYHFPSLGHLVLGGINMTLKEIPLSFAEILTLQTIELGVVCSSVWSSAREISDEREQLGYEPLQLRRHKY